MKFEVPITTTQLQERLLETFSMWADRTDVPADGVAYMDALRQQERLWRLAEDAAHEIDR